MTATFTNAIETLRQAREIIADLPGCEAEYKACLVLTKALQQRQAEQMGDMPEALPLVTLIAQPGEKPEVYFARKREALVAEYITAYPKQAGLVKDWKLERLETQVKALRAKAEEVQKAAISPAVHDAVAKAEPIKPLSEADRKGLTEKAIALGIVKAAGMCQRWKLETLANKVAEAEKQASIEAKALKNAEPALPAVVIEEKPVAAVAPAVIEVKQETPMTKTQSGPSDVQMAKAHKDLVGWAKYDKADQKGKDTLALAWHYEVIVAKGWGGKWQTSQESQPIGQIAERVAKLTAPKVMPSAEQKTVASNKPAAQPEQKPAVKPEAKVEPKPVEKATPSEPAKPLAKQTNEALFDRLLDLVSEHMAQPLADEAMDLLVCLAKRLDKKAK